MTDAQRLAELRTRAAAGNTELMRQLVDALGGPRGLAQRDAEVFGQVVKLLPSLLDLDDVKAALKTDVESLATTHLQANRDYVKGELDKLGLADENAGNPHEKQDADGKKAQAQVQQLAKLAAAALQDKSLMLQIPVGFRSTPVQDGASGAAPALDVATFDPAAAPAGAPEPGDARFVAYSQVLAHWTSLEKVLGSIQAQSPAVFAAIASGDSLSESAVAAQKLGDQDAEEAARQINSSLTQLIGNIEKAEGEVGSGIDFHSLKPLHEQVLAQPKWTSPLEKAVAVHCFGETTASEVAGSVLTAVGVMAAIAGVFATGGMAAVLAVVAGGASAGKAGLSWSKYSELSLARKARTGDGSHDLVGAEQVDAAQLEATLDTIAAFLDGVSALKGVRGALGAAASESGDVLSKLAQLDSLSAGEREAAVKAAVATMGPGPAVDAVGGIARVRGSLGSSSVAGELSAFCDRTLSETVGELAEKRVAAAAAASTEGVEGAIAARASHAGLADGERAAFEEALARRAQVARESAVAHVAPGMADDVTLVKAIEAAGASGSSAWAAAATKEAKLELICGEANAGLVARGVPPAHFNAFKKGFGDAHMDMRTWEFSFQATTLDRAVVTEAELHTLQSLAVHEARHAEQSWSIARKLAADGADASTIAARTSINEEIAEQAVASLKARPMVPGSPEHAFASSMYDSFYGAGSAHRTEVLTTLKETAEQHGALQQAAAETEAAYDAMQALKKTRQSSPDALIAAKARHDAAKAAQEAAQKVVDGSKARGEKAFQDYLQLPEERDAYGVQDEWLQMKRWEQAEAARKAAREAEEQTVVDHVPPVHT